MELTVQACVPSLAIFPVQTLQDAEGATDVDPLNTDGTFSVTAQETQGPLNVNTTLANATITVQESTQSTGFPPIPNGATPATPPLGATNWTTPTPSAGMTQYSTAGPDTHITIQLGAGNQWIATEPLTGGGSNTVIGGSGADQFIAGSGNNVYEAGLGTVIVDYSYAPSGITG
jgi:hypothetical protein